MSSTSNNPSGLAWSTKGLQSVCPTGLATFDQLIGGGFALTSVNVIDEDCDRLYATMLAKAYLASGIIAGQRLIVFSSKITSTGSRFLKELPSLVKTGCADEKSRPSSQFSTQSSSILSSEEDPMKIAFRYSKLPSRFAAHQEGEDASAQKLDFGQPLDHATVESAAVEFFDHSEILTKLHQLTQAQHSETATQANNQILRILIDELGSPLSPLAVEALPRTLHRLKVLLRALPTAVCLVTLTSDRTSANAELSSTSSTSSFDLLSCIEHFSAVRERIHSHADCVIRLIGFPEEEEEDDDYGGSLPKNPYAADYAGFLHLLRLPRLNSFAPYNAASLETTEFGLKLRNSRRYLAVEKLALPPDLGETVSRFTSSKTEPSSASSKKQNSSLPCASVLTNF